MDCTKPILESSRRDPFVLKSYQLQRVAAADEMEKRALAQFEAGLRATYVGNAFTQCAVIFASAMFCAGIGPVFHRRGIRFAMVAFAAIACVYGLVQIFTLPLMKLG